MTVNELMKILDRCNPDALVKFEDVDVDYVEEHFIYTMLETSYVELGCCNYD